MSDDTTQISEKSEDSALPKESSDQPTPATDETAPIEDAAASADSQDMVEAGDKPSDESTSTESDSPAPRRSKVLIGSQRDPANPELTPQKPKAVRQAESGVEPKPQVAEPTAATTPEPSTESGEQPAAELPPQPAPEPAPVPDPIDLPKVEIKPVATHDLEQEINDALGDVSIDELIADDAVAQSGNELEEDSRHKAMVIRLHNDDVFFSLGGRHEGVVSLRQFKKQPKLGSMMDVVVRGFNQDDGLYELSIPGASVSVGDWSDLTEGAVVETRITGSNTGGLECMINNIRGFIPASQIATHRVENLGEYINQKLQCVVQEVNPRRRKLVLSHRAIMERESQEKRKETLEKLEVGQICDGTVTSIRDFGAFVDIGGVDGLVHISKMSWDRIEHPSEVFKEGQAVKVKVEKVNKESGKISLTYRDLQEHPWDKVEDKYQANSTVRGTVSRVANFGAFVKLEPGVEGMIHISELAHHRVIAVTNVVQEGQEVECKVLSVDRGNQRMALSLKATMPEPEKKDVKKEEFADEPPRELAVPRRKGPLKGGKDKPSGGEQFGLKW